MTIIEDSIVIVFDPLDMRAKDVTIKNTQNDDQFFFANYFFHSNQLSMLIDCES